MVNNAEESKCPDVSLRARHPQPPPPCKQLQWDKNMKNQRTNKKASLYSFLITLFTVFIYLFVTHLFKPVLHHTSNQRCSVFIIRTESKPRGSRT